MIHPQQNTRGQHCCMENQLNEITYERCIASAFKTSVSTEILMGLEEGLQQLKLFLKKILQYWK